MRAEDQLKAEDEEEAQEIVSGLQEGRDDESAEEHAVEDLPLAARHYNNVVATMRSVLEGRAVDVEQLSEFSLAERQAFDVLKQVVSARGRRGGFILAETRLERLNQVLAVLQPALSIGSIPEAEQLRGDLELVIDQVDHLRHKLLDLEAAEEELDRLPEDRASDADKDDDDDGAGEVPEPDAPPRPSTLAAGPAAPDKASPPTTLVGPPVPDVPPAPTTLIGTPAAPDLPVRPTTLVGGPEAPDFASPPSTLGDLEPEAAGPDAPSTGKPARARKAK